MASQAATKTPSIHIENIPAALRALPQWVCWKYEVREDEDKPTKVPFNARTGKRAKSNNPETWVNFDHACAALENGSYDGIGFVVTEDCGIVGGDLDHCIDTTTGELHDWADKIIQRADTYTETTPSGEGMRFFARGVLPAGGRKSGNVEIYSHGRFLTMTGRHWPGTPTTVEERTAAIAAIHAEHFAEEPTPAPALQLVPPMAAGQDTDDARLQLAFGSASGSKIRDLWAGNWQAHYSSQSEADSALCFHLAFWFNKDTNRVDEMFRKSGLMRDKWDKVHHNSGETYGQKTVGYAVAQTKECYNPETRKLAAPQRVLRGQQARAYVDGMPEAAAAQLDPEDESADPNDWRTGPYGISDGRLVYIFEKNVRGEATSVVSTIANLTAYISREITTEHGERCFVIKGQNIRGRKFEFEISSEAFADEKRLKAALIAAAGAKSTVMAGMSKHLYPAIDILTGAIEQSTRYDRVGWAHTPNGDIFLMPGRENRLPEYSSVNLQGQMCYEIREGAELKKGLAALRHLMRSQNTPLLCVELAMMLQAPLSYKANWRNERYATFITGRTNSFKTETTKLMCALYGPEFVDDRQLLRWDGTTNAIMKMATLAYDMPLLVDNYKPNVGKDAAGKCINLIQSIVEGSEKARMNRDRTLAGRDAIYAWPVITGEDVPDSDAASLARILVLRFPQHNPVNDELTKAQSLSHHLCAVGASWLEWMESEESGDIIKNIAQKYLDQRGTWANSLREIRTDMQGVPRIATNLATNELTWAVMLNCPALKPLAEEFYAEHQKGLRIVAHDMASQTAESLEAHRYLEAIRQLIAVGKLVLIERTSYISEHERDRVVGWRDDDGIYLLPDLAYRAACDLLRDNGGLNDLSKNTLHKQLESLSLLASTGAGGMTINKRCSQRVQRVLHLVPSALDSEEVRDGE